MAAHCRATCRRKTSSRVGRECGRQTEVCGTIAVPCAPAQSQADPRSTPRRKQTPCGARPSSGG
eukprot:10309550-Lingulodinium_polyedra.AAC.1